jgi:hypothetical protein
MPRLPRLPGLALCAALALGPTGARGQADGVGVLVLKEHGVGSPTLAQPYVEKFVGIAAVENGWPGAQGRYVVTRAAAEAFIAEAHPHYGIFSLAAFLALREKYELEVVGRVQSVLVGGQQYFIISKNVTTSPAARAGRSRAITSTTRASWSASWRAAPSPSRSSPSCRTVGRSRA